MPVRRLKAVVILVSSSCLFLSFDAHDPGLIATVNASQCHGKLGTTGMSFSNGTSKTKTRLLNSRKCEQYSLTSSR